MRTLIKNATNRQVVRAAVWLALVNVLVIPCLAEQLPLKSYTTADGLARDSVNHIMQDSRRFLWFATAEGLSRFDGYRFTLQGYRNHDGIVHHSIIT